MDIRTVQPPVRQTVQGFTLTVYPGQIDANWTVLTYTLSSPAGAGPGIVPGRWITDTYTAPQLTTDQGRSLPFIGTLFPQFYNTDVLLWTSPITEAQMVFRTEALGAAPVQRLHLELSLAQLIPPAATAPPPPWWQLPTTPVAGPFTFDLRVPVNRQARIATIGQTVQAGKRALRLDQVIVTATETRLFLQPTAPLAAASWGNGNLPAAATLHIGDGTAPRRDGVGRMSWDGTRWVYTYIDDNLLDQPGDWTLTVAEVPNPQGGTIRGPWTFHFLVPPATAQP